MKYDNTIHQIQSKLFSVGTLVQSNTFVLSLMSVFTLLLVHYILEAVIAPHLSDSFLQIQIISLYTI